MSSSQPAFASLAGQSVPQNGGQSFPTATDNKELFALVLQLQSSSPEMVTIITVYLLLGFIFVLKRENALYELSKKRESFPDLAPVLWYSFGTMAALLQEIISLYPMLSPPTLTPQASNRVCNALALLQCVASHSDTKSKLVKSEFLFCFSGDTMC